MPNAKATNERKDTLLVNETFNIKYPSRFNNLTPQKQDYVLENYLEYYYNYINGTFLAANCNAYDINIKHCNRRYIAGMVGCGLSVLGGGWPAAVCVCVVIYELVDCHEEAAELNPGCHKYLNIIAMIVTVVILTLSIVLIVYFSYTTKGLLIEENKAKFKTHIRPLEYLICIIPFISIIVLRMIDNNNLSDSLNRKYTHYDMIAVIVLALVLTIAIFRRLKKYNFDNIFIKRYMLLILSTIVFIGFAFILIEIKL